MAAMAPWMWFVGLAAMVALAIAFPNPIIILIPLLAAFETWRRWKRAASGGEESAGLLPRQPRAAGAVAIVYLGLIALLASAWTRRT